MKKPLVMLCLVLNLIPAVHAATVGTRATFSTDFHDVSGTATVLDSTSLRIDNFTFDGQGLDVFFYLGASDTNASFIGGIPIGDQLLGTVFDGTQAPIIIELPAGQTTTDYDAISVWCVDVNVSFGSGTFVSVPEPSTGGLAALAISALLLRRRRHTLRTS